MEITNLLIPLFVMMRQPPIATLFPYTTLFRSVVEMVAALSGEREGRLAPRTPQPPLVGDAWREMEDRKSTRLNSSHGYISYAVFCLKKKNYHFHTASC